MTREELTRKILEAKRSKGLTWEAIAHQLGRHKVWSAAALMGQHPLSRHEAESVVEFLGLSPEAVDLLQEYPTRGSLGAAVPVDPTIYRFYEVIQVYGAALKSIIHEMFGDGIMSAIDFELDVERRPDPKGDRVIITFNGKFLPYKKF